MENLLKPNEVDLMLRYPTGRTLRLAKKNLIRAITLPDGEVRIPESFINDLINQKYSGGENAAAS